MSLLYVATSRFELDSANSVQTFSTCRELVRADPSVEILLPRSPRRAGDDKGLPVEFLAKMPLQWCLGARGERLERVHFAGRAAKVAAARGRVVYTREPLVASAVAAVGSPVVFEIHEVSDDAVAALAVATAVVTLAEPLATDLRAKGIARVETIPDAYDESIFHPRPRGASRRRLGIDSETFTVVYAGLTFAGRGLDVLADAVRMMAERQPVIGWLVGGQPGEAEDLGLDRRPGIQIVGRVAHEEIPTHLAAGDAIAIPDLIGDLAGSPLKLFEAAAMEVPLVVPDHPAIRPVVGGDAQTFERGSPEALAGALGEIAANPGPAAVRARALRERTKPHGYAARAARILSLCAEFA